MLTHTINLHTGRYLRIMTIVITILIATYMSNERVYKFFFK